MRQRLLFFISMFSCLCALAQRPVIAPEGFLGVDSVLQKPGLGDPLVIKTNFRGFDNNFVRGNRNVKGGQHSALNSMGNDFWLLFMRNIDMEEVQLFIDISAGEDTYGKLSVPGIGFSVDFSVTANSITRILVPSEAMVSRTGIIEKLGIRILTENDVTVYGTNLRTFSTDAFLGFPVKTLGTEYRAISYYGLGEVGFASQLAIVSAYDNNRVTITPSQQTIENRPAGTPYTITLNEGDTYFIMGELLMYNDLTGTLIVSEKPIGVFSGSSAAYVPVGYCCGDHMVQQVPPVTAWGQRFVSSPLRNRGNGDTWRFLASHENTSVIINGNQVATINAGEFFETMLTNASYIEATAPILAVQYSNSDEWDGATYRGDPFMVIIPPIEQFLDRCTFSTPADGYLHNFFNVVIHESGISELYLDNQKISPQVFTRVHNSDYFYASFPININSSHTIYSENGSPFGIIVYGFNDYDSYGYPGGLALVNIVSPIVVDVITTVPEDITSSTAVLGGTVEIDGDVEITDRGIIYSVFANPLLEGVTMTIGTGTGTFSTLAQDLTPNTTYYVMAYAYGDQGVWYGQVEEFTTLPLPPEVITLEATDITFNAATIRGEVVFDGYTNVSERGFFWGEDPDPTAYGTILTSGEGLGVYDELLFDLSPATIYYYVAYATNSAGTAFGEIKEFSTVEPKVFVPNAFMPESHIMDNQSFKPVFDILPDEYVMEIFNRWGSRIFLTDHPSDGWNGITESGAAQQGGYVYRIIYRDYLAQEQTLYGIVMLIR